MADARTSHWEDVYLSKGETELSWHEDDPEISLELFRLAGIGADASVIDIGAGTSRFAARLIDMGLRDVSVLDVSEAALDRSRRQLGSVAGHIDWISADITTWTTDRTYDIWHDRAVFHFLVDPADRIAYRNRLLNCLRPAGHAVIATFAPDGPEKCSGLPVVRYDPEGLRDELGEHFTIVAQRHHVHHTPWGSPQSFQFSLLRIGH